MRKKRKQYKQKRINKANRSRHKFIKTGHGANIKGNQQPNPLEQEILVFLHQQKEPQPLENIMTKLAVDRSGRKVLLSLLTGLCHQQILSCSSSKRKGKLYSLKGKGELVEGLVEVNPKGFGFAIIEKRPAKQTVKTDRKSRQDPFIPPHSLGSANQGDRALFRLYPKGRGRTEAKVIRVIKRAATALVGIYEAGRETSLVIPEDERYLFNVLIHKNNSCGAKNGNAVVVEVTDFKTDRRNPEGRIIEVLGDPNEIGVQNDMVIRKHNLPHSFSEQALAEAAQYSDEIAAGEDRLDLQETLHVTIDGETARDFDDAVAVERTKKGFRLYVSIADVSHYVKPGTALDRDAYERGTSVYFPTRVLPMLPERLSNNLCSLVPNELRPAFTAVMEFDRKGKPLTRKFSKSIIKSHHRLTYTIVKKILVDRDKKLIKKYSDIAEQLAGMAELARLLEQKRLDRGSIGFSLPEAQIIVGEEGEVADVVRSERNLAHKVIEEFMLAANEAVAQTLSEQNVPALYRIHEPPDDVKVMEFTVFAQTLGLHLPASSGTPQWFGRILKLVEDSPTEYIVNNLLLRTMQRARYSPENVGHFGLAATYYTHFTSPIRRYPDLLVHRALAALLQKKTPAQASSPLNLHQTGEFLSGRERAAVEAEWEMTERLQARFMVDKIGESFDGVISGVTSFGLFVELLDLFISGAIEIAKLKGDYFQFDEKNHRLIGSQTNTIFQLGEMIRVKVADVDVKRRRINFVLE
jgi:ribonuclease R